MNFKKLTSMLLAFVMVLALAVPAFAEEAPAVDGAEPAAPKTVSTIKIQDTSNAEYKPVVEAGTPFSTAAYREIYVKQATDCVIWVPASDTRSDADIQAAVGGHDGSMDGRGATVIRGNNTEKVVLHKNTYVVVSNGMMIVDGPISHVAFVGVDPQIPDELKLTPTTIEAKLSIQKLIQSGEAQVAPAYEGFTFQVLDGETVVGTITTGKTTGLGNAILTVTPGKTYTIHEVLADYQAGKYAAVADQTVTIAADTTEYSVQFVNTPNDTEIGDTSSVFQIVKLVSDENGMNSAAGFAFDIVAADGTVVKTMTSGEDGIAMTEDFFVEPGTYTIREHNYTDTYMPVEPITVTVDGNGAVTYPDGFDGAVTNIKWGALDVTADVYAKHYEEYHKLAYKYYEYGTLVAGINPKTGNNALPAGVKGDYLGNGMTYLTINKSAFNNGPITLSISQSNKTGNAKKSGTDKWNTPVVGDKTFTLSLNDKGQLVVDSGLTVEESTFGAKVYSAKQTVKGCSDIKHNNQTTYDLPKGDTFKFFIHWENTSYTLGEVIGCELDHKDEIKEVFAGDVTMTVVNKATEEEIYTGELGLVEKVAPGEYTVTIFADGEELASEDYTVTPGAEVEAGFGELAVWGETVIYCPYMENFPGFEGKTHGTFPDHPFYEAMPIEG